MAAHSLPLNLTLCLGQSWRWKPANTEAQGQRVTDDKTARVAARHVAERARAVCSTTVKHAAIVGVDVVFRGAVEQHIEMSADVHVTELESAGEGEDEGYVLGLDGLLADQLDVRGRSCGEAACEGGVAVDVELEEVEEGVVDDGDGAV